MRAIIAVLCLLSCAPAQGDTVTAFVGANVLPMDRQTVLRDQTVIVRDGRIAEIGARSKIAVPKNASVVDAKGKYLLPGLAEMHGHIPPPNAPANVIDETLFLYVANGITTVRGMLGHEGQLELREKSRKGEIVAPNLYLAGPSFNGNSVNSPEEATAKVRQQKREGWDLLKVHPGLTRDEFDAMARAAKEQSIRFGGHVPQEVGLLHAIEMGQETFDHVDGYAEYLLAEEGPLDKVKLADVVKKTRDAGAWIVPTMALWETLYGTADLKTLRSYSELQYVPQQQVDNWSTAFENRLKHAEYEAAAAKRVIAARSEILRALHDGGVRILMGTDAPQQFSVPGFSLHRELLRMRDAGMTPYDILVSGTKNVGDYFKAQDDFGTVAVGKRADLLLVDANPLDDVANLQKLSGVMVRGRWLSRGDLDKRLAEIARRYKR